MQPEHPGVPAKGVGVALQLRLARRVVAELRSLGGGVRRLCRLWRSASSL